MGDESIDSLANLTLNGGADKEMTIATHGEVPEFYNKQTITNCACARCATRRTGNLRLLDAPKKHWDSRRVLRSDCMGPKKLF